MIESGLVLMGCKRAQLEGHSKRQYHPGDCRGVVTFPSERLHALKGRQSPADEESMN